MLRKYVDCSTFLEGTEGQAEFCQGGIRWHWFEPSISEDDDETVPELWDGKEDDSSSEGESILCRRLEGQSVDTSSEGMSKKDDDEEAYTAEEVGWYEFDLWDVNSILSRKPSLRNLRKKESLEN